MTVTANCKVGLSDFRMPSLGADMQAGTVVEWRIKPGDTVKRGDVVGAVESDKGTIEVEIFESGVIDELLVPVGQRVPVGTVLALVRTGRGAVAPAASPPPPASAAPAEVRKRVSPLARKLAADLNVDLGKLIGTGPGGAINREDVERAASLVSAAQPVGGPAPVAPAAPVVMPPPATLDRATLAARQAAMRRAIAAAMNRSNREIPHYYLETPIDMQRGLEWLREANLQRVVTDRLLPAVLLLKAVALAVHEVPEVNGFWLEDQFQPSEAIHLGVAIALRTGGLVTPAIHNTDARSLDDLNAALKDLVQRARGGSLRSSEIADATLTVTNLGDQGVDKVFGVIYPPQVALVGFGAPRQRPWAVDGLLGVRPIVIATLAGDHRATDGHRGGLFLAAIDRLLQKPDTL
jgi:pyruvate dehydrogenase E2 component (dihydrolipoamide acetyltransferase)